MQFKNIIGHDTIKSHFVNTVKNNRISHAQLILGPKGVGKLSLVISYAQYISCKNKNNNDSCGECSSCKKYQKLIHPDLHFVYPVVKTKKLKKPVSDDFIKEWREYVLSSNYHKLSNWLEHIGTENLQGSIYAHESQEIIKKLNLKTFESEYKVMIIWMPEKMNISASNKLLKMIEEPPPKTLFLLVSENHELIINTIRSRTQLIKISKISNTELENGLKKEFDLHEDELKNIVRLSNGNYMKAIEIISENENNKFNFEIFVELMRYSFAAKVIEITQWVDKISSMGREKQKFFLLYTLRMVRENFVLSLLPDNQNQLVYLNNEELAFSKKFSSFINKNNISHITNELESAHRHIERNAYDKLVFLDLSLKIIKLLRIKG